MFLKHSDQNRLPWLIILQLQTDVCLFRPLVSRPNLILALVTSFPLKSQHKLCILHHHVVDVNFFSFSIL